MSETWLWCGRAEDEEDLGPREPSPRGRFPRWPRPDMATEIRERPRWGRSLHAGREVGAESMRAPLPSLKVFLLRLFESCLRL